jgi:hypothetical protein
MRTGRHIAGAKDGSRLACRKLFQVTQHQHLAVTLAWQQCLAFFGTPLVIEPSPGQLSGDAALLPVRQFDQRIGLSRAFADALDDPRHPDLTGHTFPEIVRSHVYGILAGYQYQNDHDTLRADHVFKLVADRSPLYSDLASQPTLTANWVSAGVRSAAI